MTVNLPHRAPEPRFARTAALIADPSRARMLALLLGGEARAGDALARAASTTAQTASTQLTQLLDANLLTLNDDAAKRLRDASFDAAAIASLQGDSMRKRFAYGCMDWSERREHLAGVFATKLLSHYVETRWLRKDKSSRALTETPRGVAALQKLLTTPN